ncbi:DUF3515 domain-containing protein [Rhodococcus sp. NPDC058514]|uniref:DUF3515 domain-containing protein n=1 Tax=unclassified Rhodococcus (in: high G+C Gram-positive bacteria) TaxID=192944 RepID=UPI00364C022F
MNDPDLPESAGTAEPETAEAHPTARRSPALIAAAVALPIALVVGVLVAAVIAGRDPVQEPVALGTVPAPAAESPECAALIEALPEDLGDFGRAELVDPAPVGAAAWQADDAKEVVLRCGVDRPLEFNAASALQMVDEVQWFEVPGEEGMDASTWFAVDRGVYVALTVPHGSGPSPLQDASAAITGALESRPIDPAPVPNP